MTTTYSRKILPPRSFCERIPPRIKYLFQNADLEMYFKQFYLACLAHASYLIGSEGEAAVVDPQRDVDQYISEADAQGFKIKHVIETHLHADFVSGHRELAAHTGAQIIFGARSGLA